MSVVYTCLRSAKLSLELKLKEQMQSAGSNPAPATNPFMAG
jgi:hypothetical protein